MNPTLYLLTLNCARLAQYPQSLTSLFTRTLPPTPPDVIALSLQELLPVGPSFVGGASNTDPYTAPFIAAVEAATKDRYGGTGDNEDAGEGDATVYALRGFEHVGFTGMLVFGRREGVGTARVEATSWVGLGVQEMGNKGAVGMRVVMPDGEKVILVSAHLAPDEFQLDRRNRDWENIVRKLVLPAPPESRASSDDEEGEGLLAKREQQIYAPETALIVFGDLNYRTANVRPLPGEVGFSSDGFGGEEWRILRERDQLTAGLVNGTTMHGLEEAKISFPPTYKFDLHRNGDYKRNRWPSWTDRVLTGPKGKVKVTRYEAVMEYYGSDHKPVYAWAEVTSASEEAEWKPPYDIDPNWESKRTWARRREMVAGSSLMLAQNYVFWGTLVVIAVVGAWASWLSWRGGV